MCTQQYSAVLPTFQTCGGIVPCCPFEVGWHHVKPVFYFRELYSVGGEHPAGPSREAPLRPVMEHRQPEKASLRSSSNLHKRSETVGCQDSCPFPSALQPRPSRGAATAKGAGRRSSWVILECLLLNRNLVHPH